MRLVDAMDFPLRVLEKDGYIRIVTVSGEGIAVTTGKLNEQEPQRTWAEFLVRHANRAVEKATR